MLKNVGDTQQKSGKCLSVIAAKEWLHNPQIFRIVASPLDYLNSLGWFYGLSTIVGYLMPNPVFTYILNIYDLVKFGFMAYQPL